MSKHEAQPLEERVGFNRLLERAVEIALAETMGDSGGKALRFYVDASLLAKNPDAYSEQLRKIFAGSEAGAEMIEKRISFTLSKLLSEIAQPGKMPETRGKSSQNLRASIEECRREYLLA